MVTEPRYKSNLTKEGYNLIFFTVYNDYLIQNVIDAKETANY